MSTPKSAHEISDEYVDVETPDIERDVVSDVLFAIYGIVFSAIVVENQFILYNVFDYDPFATTLLYLTYLVGALSVLTLILIAVSKFLAGVLVALTWFEKQLDVEIDKH